MKRLTTVVIVLVLVWLAVSLLGALVEGLLWLTAVGALLLVATVAYGWWSSRRRSDA